MGAAAELTDNRLVLEISLANACEACARVSATETAGVTIVATVEDDVPLPFLAPLFLCLFWVDADLESIRSACSAFSSAISACTSSAIDPTARGSSETASTSNSRSGIGISTRSTKLGTRVSALDLDALLEAEAEASAHESRLASMVGDKAEARNEGLLD